MFVKHQVLLNPISPELWRNEIAETLCFIREEIYKYMARKEPTGRVGFPNCLISTSFPRAKTIKQTQAGFGEAMKMSTKVLLGVS